MKKFVLMLTFFLSSCLSRSTMAEFNTEIVCPNFAYRFLVLHATKQEVEASIENAIEESLKSNEGNKYTVLYFSNHHSTSIYNATPQQIKKECVLYERAR